MNCYARYPWHGASSCLRSLPKARARQFHSSRTFHQRYNYSRAGFAGSVLASGFKRWAARPTFYLEAGGVSSLFGVAYVYNLETVPVSGRRRFNCITPTWEQQLAGQQEQQVLEQYRDNLLSDNDTRTRQVRRVLDRLIPNSGLPVDFEWKVYVIDSKETNAFVSNTFRTCQTGLTDDQVIPGGKAFVFTGILPVCDGDDGIAAVLGHEIGHNVARHIAEQMSRNIILIAISWLLDFASDGILSQQMSSQLMQLGIELPKSRAQEVCISTARGPGITNTSSQAEADHIGLLMMAKSCFNPQAAVTLWERMQVLEESHPTPPPWMSTHPASSSRREHLLQLMPQAQQAAAESGCARISTYGEFPLHPEIQWLPD
jgi:predicted Zn-dependent protease